MAAKDIERKYFGKAATGYIAKRNGEKWRSEQAAVETLIKHYLPKHGSVLDCPVGTGRFLFAYGQLYAGVIGVDVSPDMLAEADKEAARHFTRLLTVKGSALKLEFEDKAFDVVVSTRFLNWLTTPEMHVAIKEFCRVARRAIIFNVRFGVRVSDKSGYHPEDKVREALRAGGFYLARREPIMKDYYAYAAIPMVV